jgi:dihydroneopterin aldolase/2-amino-4-hydroxy-6-hydroxymethyldihydropteridine diphosphokinase
MEIIHKVYLGLGSNLGDSKKYLVDAVNLISSEVGPVIKSSKHYVTAALNPEDEPEMAQPDYLNMAVLCESALSPIEVSKVIHSIEDRLGLNRSKKVFWGPREIDIDILAIDDLILNESGLIVPHSEMHKRDFVLYPLKEIAPEFIHPQSNKTIDQLIAALNEKFIKCILPNL